MAEHLRALVVILALALAAFAIAKVPLCQGAVRLEDFKRRRNLWFAVTLIAFLSHNFWLMCVLTGTLVGLYAQRDSNPLALYFGLLFAVPPITAQIPGVGPINYFFDLHYIRLLNLCILFPAAVRLAIRGATQPSGSRGADLLVAGHLALVFVLTALVASFTGTARQAFMLALDIALPYYVASRSPMTREAFRELAAAFLLSTVILAGIAVFEFVWRWLLFSTLDDVLGIRWGFGNYLLRGEGGALRALASTGHSIVLGYLLLIGGAFLFFLERSLRPRALVVATGVVLLGGLVATVARGPWVGAVAMLAVVLSIGPGAGRRLAMLCAALVAVAILLALTPWGSVVVDHLPFIGSVEEGSVTYRKELFNVSMILVWQNPIFGSYDYLYSPIMEQMRQGEGIIDMVNTYLGVALASGFVGLALFVGPFVAAAFAVHRVRRSIAATDGEADALGRALLAALAGIAVTIATVSPINAVPTVYWTIAGLCVAYARVFSAARASAVNEPSRPEPVQAGRSVSFRP